MSCFDHSWSRLVLVVTAAGLCAATATGTARADDGADAASLPAAEIAAVPELEGSVTAIVVDAIEGSIEDIDATSVVPSGDADDPEGETGSSGSRTGGRGNARRDGCRRGRNARKHARSGIRSRIRG